MSYIYFIILKLNLQNFKAETHGVLIFLLYIYINIVLTVARLYQQDCSC